MTSHDTYCFVTLTIDGATSFFKQLMNVQNIINIHVSVQTRVTRNSNTGGIDIDGRILLYCFYLFCVLE